MLAGFNPADRLLPDAGSNGQLGLGPAGRFASANNLSGDDGAGGDAAKCGSFRAPETLGGIPPRVDLLLMGGIPPVGEENVSRWIAYRAAIMSS